MTKHIFCDLDGTLLKDFKFIDEKDIEALQEAQRLGHTISIATGRLDYEVKHIIKTYGFNGFRISQNGGVVFNQNNQLLHLINLETEDIKKIISELENFNVIIFYQTEDSYIVEKKVPIIIQFENSQTSIRYIENENIKNELNCHKIITISIWANKDENYIIKEHLDKALPVHLIAYISGSYTLDITNRANSKGNAINHICKLNNISLDDIIVIGDSYNDISMFNLTEHSYVMSIAKDDVKQYAKYEVNSVREVIKNLIHNR